MAQESIAQDRGARGVGERYVLEESRSRPGLFHSVDMEREYCSCPAGQRHVRCYHIRKNQCAYCEGLGSIIRYPRLLPCPVCGGDGRAS